MKVYSDRILLNSVCMAGRGIVFAGVLCGLVLLFGSGCVYTTPFKADDKTPVPIKDSYISLQKNYIFFQEYGSAVIIKNGLAVTNRHVIDGISSMKAYMSEGSFVIRDVTLSDRYDLAFIEIPCGVGKPAKTGKKIKEKEPVFSAGTSVDRTVIEGIVVSADFAFYHTGLILPEARFDEKKGKSYTSGFLYKGEITYGYSGGPVVNSEGALVGINQGFLPINTLEQSIDDSDKKHGLAYHIENVLSEFKRIAPYKEYRCEN